MYIFLDIDPEISRERRMNDITQEQNHFDKMSIEKFRKIREGYLEFFQNKNVKIVNTNKSIDEVNDEVDKIIQEIIRE